MTQMTHFREEKFLRLTFQFWDFFVNFYAQRLNFLDVLRLTVAPIKILRGLMFLSRPKKLQCIIKPTNIDQ